MGGFRGDSVGSDEVQLNGPAGQEWQSTSSRKGSGQLENKKWVTIV